MVRLDGRRWSVGDTREMGLPNATTRVASRRALCLGLAADRRVGEPKRGVHRGIDYGLRVTAASYRPSHRSTSSTSSATSVAQEAAAASRTEAAATDRRPRDSSRPRRRSSLVASAHGAKRRGVSREGELVGIPRCAHRGAHLPNLEASSDLVQQGQLVGLRRGDPPAGRGRPPAPRYAAYPD